MVHNLLANSNRLNSSSFSSSIISFLHKITGVALCRLNLPSVATSLFLYYVMFYWYNFLSIEMYEG